MKKSFLKIIFLIFIIFLGIFTFTLYFKGKKIILKEGNYYFPDGLTIKSDEELIIKPGAHLIFGEKTQMIIRGKIYAKGTKEKPIIFEGKDNSQWRGIQIVGSQPSPDIEFYKKVFKEKNLPKNFLKSQFVNGNVFEYCIFQDLTSDGKKNKENRLKAALEVKNTSLTVIHSKFSNIIHIGSIQAEKSYLLAWGNTFDAKMGMKYFHLIESVHIIAFNKIIPQRYERQTWPDGIYSKAGVGIVFNNYFDGIADDAIAYDKSLAVIIDNHINHSYDQGIDIDNQTEAYIKGNIISKTKEAGIMISERSKAILLENKIENTPVGILIRNGGNVVGKEGLIDTPKGIVISDVIPLFMNQNDFEKAKHIFSLLDEKQKDYYGYYTINNGEDAVKLLESLYKKYGKYYVFDAMFIHEDLKNLFKLVPIKKTNNFEEIQFLIPSEKKEFLSNFVNKVFLKEIWIKAEKPIETLSIHNLDIQYYNKNGNKQKIKDKSFDINEEEYNRQINFSIQIINYSQEIIDEFSKFIQKI